MSSRRKQLRREIGQTLAESSMNLQQVLIVEALIMDAFERFLREGLRRVEELVKETR